MDISVDGEAAIMYGKNVPIKGNIKIHRVFENLIRSRPELRDIIAVKDATTAISFSQLDYKSSMVSQLIAKYIRDKYGACNRSTDLIIAVCLEPSVLEIVILLAILKAGAAYLPIESSFPESRITYILDDAKPLFLITSRHFGENTAVGCIVENMGDLGLFIEDLLADHPKTKTMDEEVDDDDHNLAVVLYTSGSTGVPKGVRLLHKSILYRLSWQWKEFPYEEDEVCCAKTTRSFGDSITEIWGPLLQGVPIVVVGKNVVQNPELLVPVLEENQVSRLILVPSLLAALLNLLAHRADRKRLQQLRLWVCSGEQLSADLVLRFFDYFDTDQQTLCNFYGCTEVTADVTFVTFRSRTGALDAFWNGTKVPLGKPMDNCQIYLLASGGDKRVAAPDEVGEIYVAGEFLADGYVNNREADRFTRVSVNGVATRMFRTGDFGRIHNGVLYYEGRTDSQIKIRGYKIDLEEICAALLIFVSTAAVLCYAHGTSEQHIVAFVEAPQSTSGAVIQKVLRSKLMAHMIPKVVVVDKMPLLVNGKTDRQALLNQYKMSLCSEAEENAQTSRLDCDWVIEGTSFKVHADILLHCIRTVLGSSMPRRVKASDNYFEIGGSSLDAVAVVMKLRDLGYNFEIAKFVSAATMADIVRHMELLHSGIEKLDDSKEIYTYRIKVLEDHMRDEVTKLVATSFSTKEALTVCVGATYQEFHTFISAFWNMFLDSKLSFIVEDDAGRLLGACLSMKASEEPEILEIQNLRYVFEFVDFVEMTGMKLRFPKCQPSAGVIRVFLMTTDSSLGAAENVRLMQRMEEEVVALAEKQGFNYLITENVTPLTEQLCLENGYELVFKETANTFTSADGTKPFQLLPRTVECGFYVKTLGCNTVCRI